MNQILKEIDVTEVGSGKYKSSNGVRFDVLLAMQY